MLWVPHPSEIVTLADCGDGNMGGVADESNTRARFVPDLDWELFVLTFLRVQFTGGSGSADLNLRLDNLRGEPFDWNLWEWALAGATGGRPMINFRIAADELYQWVFKAGSALVFEWTNPDPTNMGWAIEVGIANATRQPG